MRRNDIITLIIFVMAAFFNVATEIQAQEPDTKMIVRTIKGEEFVFPLTDVEEIFFTSEESLTRPATEEEARNMLCGKWKLELSEDRLPQPWMDTLYLDIQENKMVFFAHVKADCIDPSYASSSDQYIIFNIQSSNKELILPDPIDPTKGVLDNGSYTDLTSNSFTLQQKTYSCNMTRVVTNLSYVLSEADMIVVIHDMNPQAWQDMFYIRCAYDHQKDVILVYHVNRNGCVSPKHIYWGNKELTDEALMTAQHLIVKQEDSTAPLFGVKEYWHLFAQHGYVVPTIDNDAGLTAEDVGSTWKDQLGRKYTIGQVTPTTITLLPIIETDEQGYSYRQWKLPYGTPITQLIPIDENKTPINSIRQERHTQLYPLMKSTGRTITLNGVSVNSPGIYLARNFSISETQLGYDPATISQWFPSPDTDSGEVIAQFTWDYHFYRGQCFVKTSIDINKEVDCRFYGATQQQTFFDTDNCEAMFLIPKAAPQNGTVLDKPFRSPTSNSDSYYFYRTSKYLRDVNQPIDRLIAFLYNQEEDCYKFGMSAGLSIVSGDTQPIKRLEDLPEGDSDPHNQIGLFYPPDYNKFYIAAFNTAHYSGNNYRLPIGFHRDIDYYVCFFDPAANTGQVFWYKDADTYIIYAHCQQPTGEIQLKVPEIMNGYQLDIVEKTAGATLISRTVNSGIIRVVYDTDEANFLVMKASPRK